MSRHIFRWIMSAGALLVVVGSAGCAGSDGRTQLPPPPPVSPQSAPPPLGAQSPALPVVDSEQPGRAPAVNLFGELDGIERAAGQAGGEAGFQQHTFLDEGYDSGVAVDPTGTWLVFASTRHSERAHLYLQRTDGTAVTQLTNDNAEDGYPVFSPDGKRIAFCSTRAGNWDIYVMDADGRNTVQVTSGPMQDLHPSFSPDGGRLVYCSLGSRSRQWELWTVNLSNGERRMIGYGLFPSWSPGKQAERIAFQRARARGSRWFSLWTLDLVEGEARRVTEVAAGSNAAIVCPAWSPDGQHLVFQTVLEPSAGGGDRKVSGQQDIWVISADGTNRQRLTDGNGSNLMPYWAVDNRVYFVSDRGGNECVWSVQAGVAPTALPVAAASSPEPAARRPAATVPGGATADTHEVDH